MLVLALLGLLAAASPADTSVRIPGTALRLGLEDSTVSARGFAVTAPGTRRGGSRFFGLTSEATLTFEDGRLARAEFQVDSASSYQIDYVRDQLSAMGYRRNCAPPKRKTEVCDFTGRAQVRVEVTGGSLKATVSRAAATEAPAVVAAAAPDAGYPAAARRLGRLSVPTPGPPPAAAPARDTTRRIVPKGAMVPILPETLAVAVPGRTSRYAPAQLLDEPRCGYPEAARAAGVQGRVWVLAFVDIDGRVLRARIEAGIPVLDAAALACVRGWRFQPRTWKDAPCRYRVLVPVTFTAQ